MPDMEKAINCLTDIEQIMVCRQEICPREELQYWIELQEGVADAIALLKEQKAIKRTSRKGTNGFSIVWTCGACGSDLHPNNAKAKYCSNCGQAVKWE